MSRCNFGQGDEAPRVVDYVIIRAIYCAVCVNVQGDARILVVLTDAPPTFVDD